MNLVPKSISSHPLYPRVLQIIRLIQFLSAVISLGLFSAYIARLVGSFVRAHGAVEGILAAAVAYTCIATLIVFFVKAHFLVIKLLLILLDVAFVCGFIAVAVLTSPVGRGGIATSCGLRGSGSGNISNNGNNNGKRDDNSGDSHSGGGTDCSLPTGTFVLAIIST